VANVNRKAKTMNRWFRFYNDVINDPKLLRLSDRQYRFWVGLLCIASKNDGELTSIDDMSIMLRTSPGTLTTVIQTLITARLLDEEGGTLKPHNWDKRQYKSDAVDPTAPQRMRRLRERQRNDRNADVTMIRPDSDSDSDTDKNSVANATDAAASIDPSVAERELFARGREVLGRNGGGLIANLLKAKGRNVALARAALETASQKENPAEYVGAASRGPPAARPLTEHQRKQREAVEIIDALKQNSSDSGSRADIGLLRHDPGD
jgi:hypothetical protein